LKENGLRILVEQYWLWK